MGVGAATGEDEEAQESCLVVAATGGARGEGRQRGTDNEEGVTILDKQRYYSPQCVTNSD